MSTPQLGRVRASDGPTPPVTRSHDVRKLASPNASMKDRIREWQEQGATVRKASEIVIDATGKSERPEAEILSQCSPKEVQVDVQKSADSPLESDCKYYDTSVGIEGYPTSKVLDERATQAIPSKAQIVTKPKLLAKKRDISATKLRIAQAILGPTTRPSERLRRLSGAKKERDAQLAPVIASPDVTLKKQRNPLDVGEREIGSPSNRAISEGHRATERTPAEECRADTIGIRDGAELQPSEIQAPGKHSNAHTETFGLHPSSLNDDHDTLDQVSAHSEGFYAELEEQLSDAAGARHPKSAPNSIVPDSRSRVSSVLNPSQLQLYQKSSVISDDVSASSQDDSDRLTSVSRRKLPKEPSSKGRRNIFGPKTGLFGKSILRLASGCVMPAGPARVPTIESWLRETPDPFFEANEKAEVLLHQARIKDAFLSKRQLSQRPHEPNKDKLLDSLDDEKINERRRRHRKILRHRDGTVTIEHANEVPKPQASSAPREQVASPQKIVLSPQYNGDYTCNRRKSRPCVTSDTNLSSAPNSSSHNLENECDEEYCEVENDGNAPDNSNSGSRFQRPSSTCEKAQVKNSSSPSTFSTQDQFPTRYGGISLRSHKIGGQNVTPNLHNGLSPMPKLCQKVRTAKHSDLISVLSNPEPRGIKSARSIRTRRRGLATTTAADLLGEFASDEAKYVRELDTLVDGVIPVLLNGVLSRTASGTSIGILNAHVARQSSSSLSKSIFDMGTALERLRNQHTRVPSHSEQSLLKWAVSTSRCYDSYIKAWCLGFQDVVVNLAPVVGDDEAEEQERLLAKSLSENAPSRSSEQIDVSFLLKRPLVRLKYIARTLQGIDLLQRTEETAEAANMYTTLVDGARRRLNQERARLEDRAAADLDATRSRDIRTLSPLGGVSIEPDKRVKARDKFDLQLNHSTGQRMDCTVELYLREPKSSVRQSNDLLIAEVDGTGRWLLFPPLHLELLSARSGQQSSEFILRIRDGIHSPSGEHELLKLIAEEDQIASEWLEMLSADLFPTALQGTDSPVSQRKDLDISREKSEAQSRICEDIELPGKSETSAGIRTEVPIGERIHGFIGRGNDSRDTGLCKQVSRQSPSINAQDSPASLDHKTFAPATKYLSSQNLQKPSLSPRSSSDESTAFDTSYRSLGKASAQWHINHMSESFSDLPTQPYVDASSTDTTPVSRPSLDSPARSLDGMPPVSVSSRPLEHRRFGAMPPEYHQRRQFEAKPEDSGLASTRHLASDPSIEEDYDFPGKSAKSSATQSSRPSSLQSLGSPSTGLPTSWCATVVQDKPTSSPGGLAATAKAHHRTSSPLKNEYAPSSTSSDTDSYTSTVVHDLSSIPSSSSDSELEDNDTQSVLVPLSAIGRYRKVPRKPSKSSVADDTLSPSQSASQAPYREVPQQPGKSSKAVALIFFWTTGGVWQALWPGECTLVITPGLIEAYEICSSKCTAGSSSQSRGHSYHSSSQCRYPVIGLELTPLVPIRRGTALDISIRSPPTPDSRTTKSKNNNFLFRSRSPEECETLYAMINYSRINNPTYIALQNARAVSYNPHFQDADRSGNTQAGRASSWFGLGIRRGGYRAPSALALSISKHTESSIGSIGSTFSALRKFGRNAGRFSIARSSIIFRQGIQSASLYTPNEGQGSNAAIQPSRFVGQPADGTLGLNNCKIRLYLRESTTKWTDLGSARLTIHRPVNAGAQAQSGIPVPVDGGASIPLEHSSGDATLGHGIGMVSSAGYASIGNKISLTDKRIIVVGHPKYGGGEEPAEMKTLLDVTLGETCFERVARTGIAVSVWENFEGMMVAKHGGVNAGRVRVYMMQFKNEADAAYTYSIVGKLRY